MKTFACPPRGGRRIRPVWGSGGALVLGALMVLGGGQGGAQAAPAPAGTKIGNQALATFMDANNTRQESKSNEALTMVEFVGAFTLTADNTKSAAAGNTVPMAHTLVNNGNDKDTFLIKVVDATSSSPAMTKVTIYPDTNGTGSPSGTPLCSSDSSLSATPCSPNGVPVTVAGNGGAFRFVVAYGVPGTAGTGWVGKGTVTASVPASSTTLGAYATTTDSDTDTINLTNGAAFTVSKSISIPAVKAPNNKDWPAALTSVKPSPSGSVCSATWDVSKPNGVSTDSKCNYTVYTINYSNTGASAGAFTFTDAIPSGMTYVTGSAVWSGNGGVALAEPATAPPVNYTVAGNNLTTTVTSVAPNQSGSVSFVVLVNSTAKPDGSNTRNTAKYGSTDCSSTTCAETPTNTPPVTVSQVYSVAASSTTGTTSSDGVNPLPLPASNTAPENNLVVMPSVAANGWVRFTNFVVNTGNGTDTFNMKMGQNSGFPANTQFDFFKSDGLTPLLDTNNDGIPDTGPLDPGAATTIIVKATVPPTTPVGSGPLSARIDAISAGSGSTVQDSVWDQVTTVTTSALVDLTNTAAGSTDANSGDVGTGPSNAPTTTQTATPGVAAQFSLFVKNNDSVNASYSLSASQSQTFPGTLPAGWTVKFYASGTTCSASTLPAELTSISVNAGQQTGLVACVTPPSTAVTTSSTQNIYFQVKSTTNASTGAIVSDIKLDAVTLNPASKKQLLLTNSQYGQVKPGGTVSYLHTLQNASSAPQSCGPFTVTVNSPDAGWTYAVATLDSTGAATNLTGPLPALAAGAEVKLRLTVNAPAGAVDKFINNATITVTDVGSNACGAPSNVDATSVLLGNQMGLVKEQAVDASCNGVAGAFSTNTLTLKPGACVIYRITATNNGTTPVTKVFINDMVPSYTSLTATQPSDKCVASSNATGGPVDFSNTSGSVGVTCGGDGVVIPSGGTLTMKFGVKLDPIVP